jgi:hypothetical protein
MTIQGYDLVGDIHGHADALHRLLHELGYTEVEGVFRHPQRKMIFVGDFIDRGPISGTFCELRGSVCEAGAARGFTSFRFGRGGLFGSAKIGCQGNRMLARNRVRFPQRAPVFIKALVIVF